ncbi:MAG: single-stranded DNA-binding protein [Betaproteobacteria bacterium]|nr:single-stranded DNA-binding protein [Betaproteobacteria bacterium]
MAGSLVGTVTGYVAKDPDVAANGKAMKFSIPVAKGKDKTTTWVRITTWGKTAEFVSAYVKKGSVVTVTGEMEMREYESAKGKGIALELNANSLT